MSSSTTQYVTTPTFKKYNAVARTVSEIQIKQKRIIFQLLRANFDDDAFFPRHGFTAGMFCTWQILCDTKRIRNSHHKNAQLLSASSRTT